MKKLLAALCIMLMLPLGMNSGILNEASIRVIVNRPAYGGYDHLAEPNVLYYPVSKVLTLEFPVDDFEPYTLTLATTLIEQDVFVNTPFIMLNVEELDGYCVSINLETEGGDMLSGTLNLEDGNPDEYPDE